MKVIVLSDVHANIWALDAVLKQEREYDLLCFCLLYTSDAADE